MGLRNIYIYIFNSAVKIHINLIFPFFEICNQDEKWGITKLKLKISIEISRLYEKIWKTFDPANQPYNIFPLFFSLKSSKTVSLIHFQALLS